MKIRMSCDKWDAFYSVNDLFGDEVEVDPLTLERWRSIQQDFQQMQNEMEVAWRLRVARTSPRWD